MSFVAILVFILFLLPAVLIAGYHFFLGCLGLVCRTGPHAMGQPKTRFALLIPAHNEELNIGKTIDSLLNEIDYPKELVSIYVIADNCSDGTAEIARKTGVQVFQRDDSVNRGKGYALKFAIPRILEETQCDGILIVDADCTLDRHALRSFDYRLQNNPNHPLQLNYVVDNPEDSPVSYLLGVANCLENEFFYTPKDWLNLFVVLRGTGMFLPRSVLLKYPWEAFSIVEDTDYTLQLLQGGVSVGFLGEAKVYSAFPAERKSLSVQRKRWVGGTLAFMAKQSLPLILGGLFTFRPRKMDAGITLMLLSRPLIILQLLTTTLITLLMVYPFRNVWGIPFFSAAIVCWGLYFLYFVFGVFRLGLNKKRIGLLAAIPWEICSYIGLAIRSMCSGSSGGWDRTPRT